MKKKYLSLLMAALLIVMACVTGCSQESGVISDSSTPSAHSHLLASCCLSLREPLGSPCGSPPAAQPPPWPPTSALIPPLLAPTPVTFPRPFFCQ